MGVSNPWLTPYQRSFNSIKAKLISSMRASMPEITDFTEGNIFVIIISLFSAIAEVLHYYIDNTARESFFVTARRYSSLYKHAQLVDYHIKSANPASVDLILYLNDGVPLSATIQIPAGLEFTSSDGKKWLTSKVIIWTANTYSTKISVVQKQLYSEDRYDLGTYSPGNIVYLPEFDTGYYYMEGSMLLYVNDEPWILVDTFAYSNSSDKTFKVEVDSGLKPYIAFGDGKFGAIPPANSKLEAVFYITQGASGNIAAGSFNNVPSQLSSIEGRIKVMNLVAASGGTNYEDFQAIKDHVPLSIKSLGVAITKDDFEAIAKLVPGVDKAYVDYICGRFVRIYITPDGGGVASQSLLDLTEQKLSKSKVITTNVSVYATKTAKIYLSAEITGKKSYNRGDISNAVIKALVDEYSYVNSDIGRSVRLSDIYALIDNLPVVDYLEITSLSLLSSPELVTGGNGVDLAISYYNQTSYSGSDDSTEVYQILVIDSDQYNISSGSINYTGKFGELLSVAGLYSSFDITLGTAPGGLAYNPGSVYQLTVQPMNKDLTAMHFDIPIFEAGNINLTIHEVV